MEPIEIAIQALVGVTGAAMYFLYKQLRLAGRKSPKTAVPKPPEAVVMEPAIEPEIAKRAEVDQLIAELNTALEDVRSRPVTPAVAPSAGVARASHLREEILRLASQGVDAGQIAARLLVPLAEAELLVRVSQLCQAYSRESAVGVKS